MELESVANVLNALAALLGAVCWPLLVGLMLLYFGAHLRRFLDNISEFSFKAGPSGFEAAAKRQQIKAAAMLGAASASKGTESEPGDTEGAANEIARAVSQVTEPRNANRLAGAQVLWVDDRPGNNVYERRSMEALGIHFDLGTSTDDALEKLKANRYDLVISDMGRPPDNRAGYTLLDAMRQRGMATPVVFYTGSNRPEHRAEARSHGAVGSTNNPQELFQIVTNTLLGVP